MYTFNHTQESLEEVADTIKVSVVRAMKDEGLLTFEQAEEWTAQHTVIMRKKSLFRTLSTFWNKTKEEKDHYYFLCVNLPKVKEEEKK